MYNDILNLKNRLEILNINFDFTRRYDGYALIIKENNSIYAGSEFSVIQHKNSHGLELCNFKIDNYFSDPEAIHEYLTVDEALEIIGV